MSSIKTTQIDGDVSVGRNVAIGGKADIAGSVSIGHNLKVEGWLEASNIKGINKGVFASVQDLREAYPTPHDGWLAGVGTSSPFSAYIGKGGDWVATGGTIEGGGDSYTKVELDRKLGEKVDKEAGKGLSSNDYTNEDKQKLAGLENYNDSQLQADMLHAVFYGNYDSNSKKIKFRSKNNSLLFEIDATAFIKDGMVDSCRIENENLIITFNTDSGKEPITLRLADIFDPNNYYTKQEVDTEFDKKADVSDVYNQQEITQLFAQEANEILLFGGILTDSDIDVRQQSYVGSVDVANIFWSTDVDAFVYKYLPSPGAISRPVYYMNFDGRDKYSDNDFQPYTGKLYHNINTEDYYYHLDSFLGLKMLEPKVSDMEKPVLWFNGVGMYIVQQTGISETGSWENVVYDLDSDKFVYKKVTSSGGVETVTYYDTWLNETLYNDSTTRMPRKGVMFFNAANCRFYNLSAQRTLDELNSGPTIEQYNSLVQIVGEKEQRMGVASISTLEQTSVQLSLNLYHDFRNAVGVLDVHLPTTGIGRNVASCMLHLTTDSAPAISFYFTSVEDAHISYQEGFAIEANSEYEINCLWNGGQWYIAAMKIAASTSTNSNNE